MAVESRNDQAEKLRLRSIFDLPPLFFDSCRVLHDGSSLTFPPEPFETSANAINGEALKAEEDKIKKVVPRWSCNTCKGEFESLQDQRSHFKSDFHRFNVKLSLVGKDTIQEEDFDESASDSLFKDNDISSISGSEDEIDKESCLGNEIHWKTGESVKQKLFICLQTGEVVSIWKSLLLNESENLTFDNGKIVAEENSGSISYLTENELIERLKNLNQEPRDKTQLRIVLLASGGHFAGSVFDGISVVAHKTFHRYVVRGKAGKKQSSKDASGKAANSAGASLRRYNELALKKEIQELLASWKPYFDSSLCVYIYAPSNNRQLFFNGEKPYFSHSHCIVRHVPFNVRRPTLKETKRIYNHLTNMVYEVIEKESPQSLKDDLPSGASGIDNDTLEFNEEQAGDHLESKGTAEASQVIESFDGLCVSDDNIIIGTSTPLHEAAMTGNVQQTLELLEHGLDPCIKDERGRTPYMLASDKEVRNTFRRFMALNMDMWDWFAAKVPSALTKEMEELQTAKQAEKDAKRKARSKELKKLRKAKEKKAQAQASVSQNVPTVSQGQGSAPVSVHKVQSQSTRGVHLSKEEELKRAQAEEREKRAAAAEKRIAAALNAQKTSTSATSSNSEQPPKGIANDINCSCCNVSLAGKVPFHRYHYKYCSTSCMHVHKEMLEDG